MEGFKLTNAQDAPNPKSKSPSQKSKSGPATLANIRSQSVEVSPRPISLVSLHSLIQRACGRYEQSAHPRDDCAQQGMQALLLTVHKEAERPPAARASCRWQLARNASGARKPPALVT